MIKSKEIRDLISFLAELGLEEVKIETDEIKLHIRKSSAATTVVAAPAVQAAPVVAAVQAAAPIAAAPVVQAAQQEQKPAAPAASNLVAVKSPMIGTFYRSSKPEAPSFVNVGDVISKGQVVCIIEAMKLFNEIESEVSGRVVQIMVDNASPVEYDQPLFMVEPM